ncbi:unnamed protein product [Acanthoscelides obtectus]|uniref:Uncharacterized protein n=1 Tax=Acanthoscelides obtectus TaxID=200917 RepID=A0A9P0LEJ9_ACAOB|nr:unnamed protein product [Acanthoscelides obtectus]CAK1620864.1 hypothetical protein AOBTE_LOCUS625 [Acanthoscelides obtectus]
MIPVVRYMLLITFLTLLFKHAFSVDDNTGKVDSSKGVEKNSAIEEDDLETAYRTYLPLFVYRKRQTQRINRGG